MNVLQTLGGFLQDCLQTNTAREIINNAWNIYYDYKRYRSLACLLMSLLLGAGGATLFVLEPSICGYFQSIVLQGLPFIGSIAAKVLVGIIGFWIGGGVGFNSAKYVSQQISQRTLGHSNTAYTFNDSDLERIIKNNPQIYQNKSDIGSGLTALSSAEDVQQLKTYLEYVRDQIDNYSNSDPILHDRYKNAFLKALQMSNLSPLLEIIGSNRTSQDIKKNIAVQTAHYIGDVTTQFFIPKNKDDFTVKVQKSDEEESDDGPMPHADLKINDDVISPIGLKKNVVVFSNLKRMTKEMNQQKNYPVHKSTSNKGGKQLSEQKQEALLHSLKHTYQKQDQAQQAEMILIPDKFKAVLGMRRT